MTVGEGLGLGDVALGDGLAEGDGVARVLGEVVTFVDALGLGVGVGLGVGECDAGIAETLTEIVPFMLEWISQ